MHSQAMLRSSGDCFGRATQSLRTCNLPRLEALRAYGRSAAEALNFWGRFWLTTTRPYVTPRRLNPSAGERRRTPFGCLRALAQNPNGLVAPTAKLLLLKRGH